MKKVLLLPAVILLFLSACLNKETANNRLETEIDTSALDFKFANFSEALTRAKTENKYSLVYITMDGCGPCIQMQREVFTDTAVQQFFKTNFVCSKVHIKRTGSVMPQREFESLNKTQLDFIEAHDLGNGFPTFVVFDPSGNIVNTVTKFMEPEAFIQFAADSRLMKSQ